MNASAPAIDVPAGSLAYDLFGATPAEVQLVDVPERNFLFVEGTGNPNTAPAWREAMEALYAVSYGLRFGLKARGIAYSVGPLEALWWLGDEPGLPFDETPGDDAKAAFAWCAMIWQPDAVTPELAEEFRLDARRRAAAKHDERPGLERIRFERWTEGPCVQVMHIGPYDAERPTIERLHRAAAGMGASLRGRHHEIYLGDPRRTRPERLRTLIRQPVLLPEAVARG